MPTPKSDETRKEYISRCIPIVLNEKTAKSPSQAAAICYSMWSQHLKKKRSRAMDEFAEDLLRRIKLMEENKKNNDKIDKEKFNKFGTN
jgi:hypothetical protein